MLVGRGGRGGRRVVVTGRIGTAGGGVMGGGEGVGVWWFLESPWSSRLIRYCGISCALGESYG